MTLRLHDPSQIDPATTHRIWQGVVARRVRRQANQRRLSLLGAFAVGVVAALVSLKTIDGIRRGPAPTVSPEPAALQPRAGQDWTAMQASVDADRTVDFEDGSRIELAQGGRLAPLENTSHAIVLHLAAGRALFDVRPNGARKWTIEAGLVTVEVVGTRFTVTRTETDVRVEVERGVVLVRGERIPDHVRRLEAGERIQVVNVHPSEVAPPTPVPSVAPPPSERNEGRRDESAWRELADRGAYREAYASLGASGIAARTKTADLEQLLALADVARLSGHAAEAIEPLRRAVAEHARDPRAALAAFTLGRVHLDSLGDAPAAAGDFRDALSLGLPQALIEDAYLRLIEARAKASDRAGAHRAWEEYVERFPNSLRRTVADRWGREP